MALTDREITALQHLQTYTITTTYTTDDDGVPLVEPLRSAMLRAVRQQAAYATEINDPTGARGAVGSATIGTLTLNGPQTAAPGKPGATHAAATSPHALATLKTWGLLSTQNEVQPW